MFSTLNAETDPEGGGLSSKGNRTSRIKGGLTTWTATFWRALVYVGYRVLACRGPEGSGLRTLLSKAEEAWPSDMHCCSPLSALCWMCTTGTACTEREKGSAFNPENNMVRLRSTDNITINRYWVLGGKRWGLCHFETRCVLRGDCCDAGTPQRGFDSV